MSGGYDVGCFFGFGCLGGFFFCIWVFWYYILGFGDGIGRCCVGFFCKGDRMMVWFWSYTVWVLCFVLLFSSWEDLGLVLGFYLFI